MESIVKINLHLHPIAKYTFHEIHEVKRSASMEKITYGIRRIFHASTVVEEVPLMENLCQNPAKDDRFCDLRLL